MKWNGKVKIPGKALLNSTKYKMLFCCKAKIVISRVCLLSYFYPESPEDGGGGINDL